MIHGRLYLLLVSLNETLKLPCILNKNILRYPVKLAKIVTLPLPTHVRTHNKSHLPFNCYFLTVHKSVGPSKSPLLSTMNGNQSLVFCEDSRMRCFTGALKGPKNVLHSTPDGGS